MNCYTLTDLFIGKKESFSVTITENMQRCFTELSGDINPLHILPDFAQRHGFNDIVVYGMLSASFYSTLVGVYLPGEFCIFQECRISFNKPVYINDSLCIEGIVSEINEVFSRITIKAEIKNQYGKKVSKATLIVGLLDS